MRLLIPLLVSYNLYGQCIPFPCFDNLPCTADECIEMLSAPGYNCTYTPILFCNDYPCDTNSCKVRIALQDSCNYCFWRSDVSGANPDSIIWDFYGQATSPVTHIRLNTFDTIVCPYFPFSGAWTATIRIFWQRGIYDMIKVDSRDFFIDLCERPNHPCQRDTCINGICTYYSVCECTSDNDCDDNNGCTIDQCFLNHCRNQKGYSTLLSNVSKSWWGENCCCN